LREGSTVMSAALSTPSWPRGVTGGTISAMSGGQLAATAFGTTSEHLAEAVLSAIAFTTRIERQNDIGHDFHCILHVPLSVQNEKGGAVSMLTAGPPFNVQVKSADDRKRIRYVKEHARRWIATQQYTAFFICIVDRSVPAFKFYSTWNLHNAIQNYGYGEQ